MHAGKAHSTERPQSACSLCSGMGRMWTPVRSRWIPPLCNIWILPDMEQDCPAHVGKPEQGTFRPWDAF
eukprot:869290-Amphidinium_carterae.1